jgi:hypothetical protein
MDDTKRAAACHSFKTRRDILIPTTTIYILYYILCIIDSAMDIDSCPCNMHVSAKEQNQIELTLVFFFFFLKTNISWIIDLKYLTRSC